MIFIIFFNCGLESGIVKHVKMKCVNNMKRIINLLFAKKEKTIVEEVFTASLVAYLLSTLAYSIGPIVDGAMIGNHLGVEAVASYGLIWPIVFVYSMIGAILSGGLRNLYTDLLADGKTKEANRAFTVVNIICLLISLALCIITIIFMTPIIGLLGADGSAANLAPQVRRYIYGYIIGVPFMNGATVLSSFMNIDADGNRAIYSVVVMTIVDIIGDFIAIYVLHGDLFEIALATSIGNIVYFIILSLHFLRKKRILKFDFEKDDNSLKYIIESFNNGATTGVARIASAIGNILINRILTKYTIAAFIAAYSVHRSMSTIVNATYLGVADTVWMLSSIYFGEEDIQSLDELQRVALRIGLIICVIASVLLIIFSPFLAGLYIGKTDSQAYRYALQAIRFFAYSTPFYLIVYSFEDYLYGVKKTLDSYLYTILVESLALVPAVYILVRLIGGQGARYATLISLVFIVLLTYIYIKRQPHGKNFHDKRLLLEDGFGVEAGAELSLDANSMFEVVGMSKLAGLFCKENGLSEKQGYYLSLCIEEMAGNIIEHGFNDGKPHTINMRILAKKDEVILRLRDNCRPFDPIQRYEMTKSNNDPLSNIGIKMVVKMCKEIHYLSTFNTNNLIIKI